MSSDVISQATDPAAVELRMQTEQTLAAINQAKGTITTLRQIDARLDSLSGQALTRAELDEWTVQYVHNAQALRDIVLRIAKVLAGWTGDPAVPQANIDAMNERAAGLFELVADQEPSLDDEASEAAREDVRARFETIRQAIDAFEG